MKTDIAAVVISLISLIATIVLGTKNYKKSKRLECLQRRDHLAQRRDYLAQKISDLNARNAGAQLILARYEIVAVKNAGLALCGEQAERNTALIASIKKQREGVEEGIKSWDENIKKLHFIYSNLTLDTDAVRLRDS